MQLRNTATGGVFSCDDVMGNRLLAEGGYERVRQRVEPAPATAAVDDPAEVVKTIPAAPKRAPRKAAGA